MRSRNVPFNSPHSQQNLTTGVLTLKIIYTKRKRTRNHFYRPPTKFAKVMFLHLSVSHSVHGGQYLGRYPTRDQVHSPSTRYPPGPGTPPGPDTPPPGTRYTPWDQVHPPDQVPPEQCMLGDTGNKRAVRILLECILVEILFLEDISPFCGTTDIPVLDFWWHLPWVSKLGCIPLLACFVACEQWIPQIHLWCNTFWPLGSYYYLFDLCRCRYSVWPLDSPRTYLEAMSLSLSHQYKKTLKQK